MHAITIMWNGFSTNESISCDIDDEDGVDCVFPPPDVVGKEGSVKRDGNAAGAETGAKFFVIGAEAGAKIGDSSSVVGADAGAETGNKSFVIGAEAGVKTGDISSATRADVGAATREAPSIGDCAVGNLEEIFPGVMGAVGDGISAEGAAAFLPVVAVSIELTSLKSLSIASRPNIFLVC